MAGPGVRQSEARAPVAIAHDYLTQRGGAERVVLDIAQAFPSATLYTSLYDPEGTFPDFAALDVRTSPLDRVSSLRRHHRLAFPLLAPAMSKIRIDADVTIASSSGWAHGVSTTGHLVVYCHAPARWLYQSANYAGRGDSADAAARLRRQAVRAAIATLGRPLRRWDRGAAQRADRYLANSTVTARAIAQVYGLSAEIVPPPPALTPGAATTPVTGLYRDFVLCVARLLPYKNVDRVIEAFDHLPDLALVVVGAGPDRSRLEAMAVDRGSRQSADGTVRGRISLLGRRSDEELRWLYANSLGLVAASIEDYGLTPLEAASFGRPTFAFRAGGYLDTVADGESGLFFDSLDSADIAAAVRAGIDHRWSERRLLEQAEAFSAARFRSKLREIVDQVDA